MSKVRKVKNPSQAGYAGKRRDIGLSIREGGITPQMDILLIELYPYMSNVLT